MRRISVILALTFISASSSPEFIKDEKLWCPDLGNGFYKNPVIYADYSDPDVIRVGDDFYMVSSSLSHFPGLPVLQSKDLVNWTIIGHAAISYPFPEFERPQHGNAIWAPSIRYHNGEYYIYFGDPDRGVFMTKTKDPRGPWQPLRLVRKVTGWIDCCPFWDEDGSAYIIRAYANSRVGIKSILAINKMSADGTEIYDDGVLVFNGQMNHPTIEGPKLYKRNGYYYIFAPAGGVKYGWQTVLRSKNIFGPYEEKVTLEQGSSNINGPHQGAWVTTQSGEDWFIHFQDRYAYGRIVHLQPMRWDNDWPIMGIDYDGNGIGQPVSEHRKPNVGGDVEIMVPQTNDEFMSSQLGLQWQWQANYRSYWYSLSVRPGFLRLFSQPTFMGEQNLWNTGSLLLQKFPAESFAAITKLEGKGLANGEKSGLIIFGLDYSYIALEKQSKGYRIIRVTCKDARKGTPEVVDASAPANGGHLYLKIVVTPENSKDIIPKVLCTFSFSTDAILYHDLGEVFVAREGLWVGAKAGLFSTKHRESKKRGYADIDWFKILPIALDSEL